MSRLLSFPQVGHLQIHNVRPRIDLTPLRHHFSSLPPNTKLSTTYKYTSPSTYSPINHKLIDDEDTPLIKAIDFFQKQMWLPNKTYIHIEAQRTVITDQDEELDPEWTNITKMEASKAGILIVSQKNITGGYYKFTTSSDKETREVRTILTPGQMALFKDSLQYQVSPMITNDTTKPGIRDTLIITVE